MLVNEDILQGLQKHCQAASVCYPPPFPHGPLWLASGSHPTACLCLSSLSDLRYCTTLYLFGKLHFLCCIPASTPHSLTRLDYLKWCETNYKYTFFCVCLNGGWCTTLTQHSPIQADNLQGPWQCIITHFSWNWSFTFSWRIICRLNYTKYRKSSHYKWFPGVNLSIKQYCSVTESHWSAKLHEIVI